MSDHLPEKTEWNGGKTDKVDSHLSGALLIHPGCIITVLTGSTEQNKN